MLATLALALFSAAASPQPADDVDVLAAVAAGTHYVAPAYVLENAPLATRLGLRSMSAEQWAQAQANHDAVTVIRPLPPEYSDATHAHAELVVIIGSGSDWTARSISDRLEKSAGGWRVTQSQSMLISWWTKLLKDAVRVGDGVKAPTVVKRREPLYPEEARRAHIEGIVIVAATIDTTGHVVTAEILKPLSMGLADAALDAVRQWEFTPATVGGKPVDVLFNLTIAFRLGAAPEAIKDMAAVARQVATSAGMPSARVVTVGEYEQAVSHEGTESVVYCTRYLDFSRNVDGADCDVSTGNGTEWTSTEFRSTAAGSMQIAGIAWWLPVAKTLAPHRVGADVKAPVMIAKADPHYTDEARKNRVSGIVISEVLIDKAGRVVSVRVLKPLPFGLAQSAVDALKQWRFRPATLNGEPVDIVYNLTTNFRLDSPPHGDQK
jgi:TonB family protein